MERQKSFKIQIHIIKENIMNIKLNLGKTKIEEGFNKYDVESLNVEIEISTSEVQEILKGGEKELLLELLKRVAK